MKEGITKTSKGLLAFQILPSKGLLSYKRKFFLRDKCFQSVLLNYIARKVSLKISTIWILFDKF